MQFPRSSGILLHPTSLPGPGGIGELGDAAFQFVDFLHRAGMTWWQVLPLGPTSFGDSPYASFSSFAGNPYMIALDRLSRDKWIEPEERVAPYEGNPWEVDFGKVFEWKMPLLRRAALNFLDRADSAQRGSLMDFCQTQKEWLDDYCLFVAVKLEFERRSREAGLPGGTWNSLWDRDIALREPGAMRKWSSDLQEEIAIQQVLQYWFRQQWMEVKRYANDKGVRIMGDVPIFVALDSADVWASPESFLLDEEQQPTVVSGVPPDYFSANGQRWGNPLYNWQHMQNDGFRWWIRRFQGTCEMVDAVRVDHFRGFAACWTIPASEPTAIHGQWVAAPGQELFDAVRNSLGDLPLVAEDLGVITADVEKLRDDNHFPGMKVLQFAFDNPEDREHPFLPHNHVPNSVVYTGTHDNDTSAGWYASREPAILQSIEEYLGHPIQEPEWEMIRLAFSSVAHTAIVPMQDVLGLGSDDRMNTPSTNRGNWRWRLVSGYGNGPHAQRLARLASLYGRKPR